MTETGPTDAFVNYLLDLKRNNDRGALAALRRGLGMRPGEAPEMFPYVVRFLPERPSLGLESTYYLLASLFALHPEATENGNLGNHLAACIKKENDRAAMERRFVALLNSHPDDLGNFLRQNVSYLKSKEQPINYHQLMRDLLNWSRPERSVQRRWAAGFWGQNKPIDEENSIKP